MKKTFVLVALSLASFLLPGCTLWKHVRPLSGDEKKALYQYQNNARQFYEGGRFSQAIQQAQRALELDPGDENSELIVAWSHLYLDTRDDIWAAEREFRDLSGGGLFSKENREAVLGHGFALGRQGDFYEAAALAMEKEGAPATDSKKASQLSKLRKEAAAKYAEAIARLQRAYDLDPKATDALAALQQMYALQGNYEESVGYGKQFVEAASKSWPFWEKQIQRTDITAEEERMLRTRYESSRRKEIASRSLLASCRFKQERFSEALGELDALLQLDPERTEEYFNRALCREKVGDLSRALQDMETFLKKTTLDYSSPQVRKAYDSIAQWKDSLGKTAGSR